MRLLECRYCGNNILDGGKTGRRLLRQGEAELPVEAGQRLTVSCQRKGFAELGRIVLELAFLCANFLRQDKASALILSGKPLGCIEDGAWSRAPAGE